VVSIVGVNGTGKTTTCAKLGSLIQSRGQSAVALRLVILSAPPPSSNSRSGDKGMNIPVVAGAYHADPAAVAARRPSPLPNRAKADYLLSTPRRPPAPPSKT
jgi:fused signal recognition particle receptor